MTETLTRPVGSVAKTCELCGRDARTKSFKSPGGRSFDLCGDCYPGAPKPKSGGKKRPLYSDSVMEILYRLGGATPTQAARLLVLAVPEVRERDREARRRRAVSSKPPSYEIVRRALVALRKERELEPISLHRAWDSNAGLGSRAGRGEVFHRYSKSLDGREAVVEAAYTAGGKEDNEEAGYRLHWSGGSKDDGSFRHSAHRNDWLIHLVESLHEFAGLNEHGARIDFDSIWGESAPIFPLVGAKLEKLNAAGEKKYTSKDQKKTQYAAHREFERVVPDFVLEISFGGSPGGSDTDPVPNGTGRILVSGDGSYAEEDYGTTRIHTEEVFS